MEPQSPRSTNPAAGGCLLAVSVVVGGVAGVVFNQPSLGIVLGIAAGAVLATIVWLIDRRR
jgi:uncharacterized membrane protein